MDIYGADYYPEHWDRSFWKKHVELMKVYGIEWVRIGEFMWSVVERSDGEFDFSLLDEAIELLSENGIKIILGTPTATPPAWLVSKYPEILPVDWNGRVRGFGSRRHYSPNSKAYLEYALRIVEQYASRYGDVIDVWQIDNEFGCHGTTYSFGTEDLVAFREWLKEKYGTLENLNRHWGTVFWSQTYKSWDEIVFPINTPTFENPHQMLDIYRFMSDSSIRFLKSQVEVIRKYSSKPVTHNFMVDFMDLDYRKMARYVDFVSWDNYIATEEYDPLRQSANHSLMRSLKHQPFLVIEQQPARVNWRQVNENYESEYLAMWTKQAYLNGAMGVMPFRFDQIRFGAEQYHAGLLDYYGRPTKRLEAYSKAKSQTPGVITPKPEVAIFFDYENEWIHRINHLNRNFKYWDAIVDIYKAVKKLGYNAEFVFNDDKVEGYDVLIVPYASYISEEFMEKIKKFEGPVYLTAMSSIKDRYNWLTERMPWHLIDEFGIEVVDFGGIKKEKGYLFSQCVNTLFWKDELEVFSAKVIGSFENGTPLATVKNNRYYVASVLDENGWKLLLSENLKPRVLGKGYELVNVERNGRELTVVLNTLPIENNVYIDGSLRILKTFELMFIG